MDISTLGDPSIKFILLVGGREIYMIISIYAREAFHISKPKSQFFLIDKIETDGSFPTALFVAVQSLSHV